MDTSKLKKFAPQARNLLIDQISVKLRSVLADDSAARRENPKALADLENQLRALGEKALTEKVAYIWFNRLSALRYMDANGLNTLLTVSPAEGQSQPQILAEAMAGHIDTSIVPEATAKRVLALLSGTAASPDPQDEAYRLLLVAACNHWHGAMPFMFETIADFTELLMPSGLLAPDSVLARLRAVMTDEACQDVEIIGWLYQFYISEKKDQVFAGLKKNQKITAENIPAATQLFTPHWIVRYLVENSLGRLWLLNRPGSKLAERMDYYIAPEEPETDFLKVGKPEEIKVCDPACGSGHMLTYAFDLLYAIYEEEGYEADRIPALILANNLTGVEIDDRAGALAAFALAMKAAARLGRRRFLRMPENGGPKPDIVVLQNVSFTPAEMRDVAAVVGRDLFTDELRETLGQFEQAKNFGSLIVPKLRDPAETLRVVEARDFGGDLLLKEVQERVLKVLEMAEALSPKYHVVVANPPYMASKGMNGSLGQWISNNYPTAKADLMTAFIERSENLVTRNGFVAAVTLDGWMFLANMSDFRARLLERTSLASMVHIGWNAFPDGHLYNRGTAFVLRDGGTKVDGTFVRLADLPAVVDRKQAFFERRNAEAHMYRVSSSVFDVIPGQPIAYWASEKLQEAFANQASISDTFDVKAGISTGKNESHIFFWPEVSASKISNFDHEPRRFVLHNKGGEYRKWYGNIEHVLDYSKSSISQMETYSGFRHDGRDYFGVSHVGWTKVTSSGNSFRLYPEGLTFDSAGLGLFPKDATADINDLIGSLNSKVSQEISGILNPTINLTPNVVARIPLPVGVASQQKIGTSIALAKSDWDAYETSWDFTALPLRSPDHRADTLEATYARLRAHWQGMTDEMQRLEEENNRIFIDAYGLADELTPEVPIEEITLTCNPAYRYGVKGSEADRETRLRADTMAEFLSYAVGCMFGRYSLDAPGLILANQGETLADYLARVPEPSFLPDEDNVIPVLDADWFPDDIVDRFRKFLRVTFGEENFAENLRFIEEAIGKDLRKFFLRDFYEDHVKRYKKRPIYWMFSSPKGSFQALIYMHRYRPDTVSVVLNEYLREYMRKLQAHREQQQRVTADPGASASAKTKAEKEIEAAAKILAELEAYERDVLYQLATRRVEIDLDDGVKANYPKFGDALKPIKGLSD